MSGKISNFVSNVIRAARESALTVKKLARDLECMGLGSHSKHLIYGLLSRGNSIFKYKQESYFPT